MEPSAPERRVVQGGRRSRRRRRREQPEEGAAVRQQMSPGRKGAGGGQSPGPLAAAGKSPAGAVSRAPRRQSWGMGKQLTMPGMGALDRRRRPHSQASPGAPRAGLGPVAAPSTSHPGLPGARASAPCRRLWDPARVRHCGGTAFRGDGRRPRGCPVRRGAGRGPHSGLREMAGDRVQGGMGMGATGGCLGQGELAGGAAYGGDGGIWGPWGWGRL